MWVKHLFSAPSALRWAAGSPFSPVSIPLLLRPGVYPRTLLSCHQLYVDIGDDGSCLILGS